MSEFPQTDITRGWGRNGTEGGPHESFYKRYRTPLERFARFKFPGASPQSIQDWVQGFFAREIERDRSGETPIFERYAPGAQHQRKFRNYLASAFWRYSRDEYEKEARRRGVPLDDSPELADGDNDEFERLVARDFLNSLRRRVLAELEDAAERAFFELKWPADIDAEPPSDTAIQQGLNAARQAEDRPPLSRSQWRTIKKSIVGRIAALFDREVYREVLDVGATDQALKDYFKALGREQRRSEARA